MKTLSQHQADIDAEAKRDAAIEHYKQAVHLTTDEVAESFGMMTDAEFWVFCSFLSMMANHEPENQLTYFETTIIKQVKHACRGVIQLKAEKMVEEIGL